MAGADLLPPQAYWPALAVAAYLLGSIPFGLLLVRWKTQTDIRQAGSGNIGATNVTRVAGKGLGALTLLLDVGKGVVPVVLARIWGLEAFAWSVCGAAAFLGHCFPLYTRLKGGKGIATGLGVIAAMHPPAAALGVAVFGLVFAFTRISAAGTLAGAAAITVTAAMVGVDLRMMVLLLAMVAVVVFKHLPNIRRMMGGRENRF